jgi:hypothetical protein
MGIGASVFLLAIGAILAFAVTDNVSDVDLTAVGYIVMAAGLIGLAWSLYLTSRTTRRAGIVHEDAVVDPAVRRTTTTRDVY